MNSLFYAYAFAITSVVISIGSLVTQILCFCAMRHVDAYSKQICIWLDHSYWLLTDIKNNTQREGTKQSVTSTNGYFSQVIDGDHNA